ncbi:MAG: hypothetical protein AABX11_01465 [Nanoarchaeota archaeon]
MNGATNYWVFTLRENPQVGAVIDSGASNRRMFDSLHKEGKIVHVYEGPNKAYVQEIMAKKRDLMDALPELRDRPLASLLKMIVPDSMPR